MTKTVNTKATLRKLRFKRKPVELGVYLQALWQKSGNTELGYRIIFQSFEHYAENTPLRE